MKFYMAASYARREEIAEYAEQLRAKGHEVIARWLDGVDASVDGDILSVSNEGIAHKHALADLHDVYQCSSFILFSDDGPTRGGKHFETGYFYALSNLMYRGLPDAAHVYVIGRAEMIFHRLPYCHVIPTWAEFLESV